MLHTRLFAVVLLICSLQTLAPGYAEDNLNEAARAKRIRELSAGLRLTQKVTFHSGYLFIGDLARAHRSGKPCLPLTDNQEQTIASLDDLIFLAQLETLGRDADYLEGNPRDFAAYLERSKTRQARAIHHGQLMTFTGLLSPAQTRYTLQHYIAVRKWRALQIDLIQELFKLTTTQKRQLRQAQTNYNKSTKPLFLGSMRPKADQRDIQAGIELYKAEFRRASRAILTPAQNTKYNALLIQPQPPEVLPATPPLSNDDQQRLALESRSPIFRSIRQQQKQLNLSVKQQEFLQQLTQVTQRGLLWIETSQATEVEQDRPLVSHSQAAFLKHAEQVALQGILSEQQAQLVLDAS
ncbi:hypothetical protein FYZ48_24505 [Gimesia chilikensis]|uniref:hypothetical protein n=1 Tax=Gimesia chilikensis TaxID=2605989 RepID=UPI0011ED5EDD|nr:hypothetical protein [Gimesia chilikensis]KAA0133009.1 hypothetical protein FYZ48_24505 [Gimesia chilikensis]